MTDQTKEQLAQELSQIYFIPPVPKPRPQRECTVLTDEYLERLLHKTIIEMEECRFDHPVMDRDYVQMTQAMVDAIAALQLLRQNKKTRPPD